MANDNEQDVLKELVRIIGQHSDWLDGHTFQRLALHAAEAYFDAQDIDQLISRRLERVSKQGN